MSSRSDPEQITEAKRCKNCQHSVDVRGVNQIVCLAHLTIKHPATDEVCAEYEEKLLRSRTFAAD